MKTYTTKINYKGENHTITRELFEHPIIAEVQRMLRTPKNRKTLPGYNIGYGHNHPICREIAKFFKNVDKAQKEGIQGVVALQNSLNPVNLITKDLNGKVLLKIEKANGKPIKPVRMIKVKTMKAEPETIKTEIRRPVTMLSPSIKIEAGNIEIKYNKFPGWTKIKWFRANNWKWDNKRALHVKKYTYGNLKKLTETINN